MSAILKAQTSTPTPTNTPIVEKPGAVGNVDDSTVVIKQSTAKACSDAFARVPELEGALSNAITAKTNLELTITSLKDEIDRLEANDQAYKKEARDEINSLRAMILELSRIASKRSKTCFICF